MFESLLHLDGGWFDPFRRLERELDELFGPWPPPVDIHSAAWGSFPALNLGSTPDRVEVYLFTPGVDPKSLSINLQQNVLTVAGERPASAEQNATCDHRERFAGRFYRAVTLPEDVDPDQVEAQCRDGIVRISIGRREAAKPRQIEVK
ncbi:Hsp20/alpha crystallin family protein [Candidatus Methylocalor cossyra]|uniref:Heat shock protein Hsp20 n=1 Tax=Candidatus Methylocalor cossyra TaxID=3108543 RepID=A0ABP1C4D2_9GAMM